MYILLQEGVKKAQKCAHVIYEWSPSEGKETQELQEVVFETSSDIYKLEKVVETNEYEIPDLWKLKVAKSQI